MLLKCSMIVRLTELEHRLELAERGRPLCEQDLRFFDTYSQNDGDSADMLSGGMRMPPVSCLVIS